MTVAPSSDRPCRHWMPLDDGTGEEGYCGETPTRRYLPGDRCMMHTPAALAFRPEDRPDPARSLSGMRAAAGLPEMRTPSSPTIVDTRAIASGKRRSSPNDYRAAQAASEHP